MPFVPSSVPHSTGPFNPNPPPTIYAVKSTALKANYVKANASMSKAVASAHSAMKANASMVNAKHTLQGVGSYHSGSPATPQPPLVPNTNLPWNIPCS